jgi:ferritin-like metal-binding protein YciE
MNRCAAPVKFANRKHKADAIRWVFHPLSGYWPEFSLDGLSEEKSKRKVDIIMSTLRETFLDELADVYDAEKQILKALPKMAQAAQHEDLRHAFEEHLEQTEAQVERLEQVFEVIGEEPKGKGCKAMEGILKEGEELIKEHHGDAAMICAAQKVEHYEIASYGSLQSWARLLGEDEAADLLEETLDEERDTDERLTEIAETAINVDETEEEQDEEEGEEQPPKKSAQK